MLRGELWYTLQSASGRVSLDADWMQEAQSLLFQHAKTWNLQNGEDFETFIYGLVWREANKYYHQNYRKPLHKIDSEASSRLQDESLSDEGCIDTETDRKWLKTRVIELMEEHLEADERRILKMYFFQGKTQEQIGDVLGIKKQSLNERLLRILQKLKEIPDFTEIWSNTRGLY